MINIYIYEEIIRTCMTEPIDNAFAFFPRRTRPVPNTRNSEMATSTVAPKNCAFPVNKIYRISLQYSPPRSPTWTSTIVTSDEYKIVLFFYYPKYFAIRTDKGIFMLSENMAKLRYSSRSDAVKSRKDCSMIW